MGIEIFRHGARETINKKVDIYDTEYEGELTTVGMTQHYNLGKILR